MTIKKNLTPLKQNKNLYLFWWKLNIKSSKIQHFFCVRVWEEIERRSRWILTKLLPLSLFILYKLLSWIIKHCTTWWGHIITAVHEAYLNVKWGREQNVAQPLFPPGSFYRGNVPEVIVHCFSTLQKQLWTVFTSLLSSLCLEIFYQVSIMFIRKSHYYLEIHI